jgi:hypothetical protein
MGFFSEIISATVKVACTPITIVQDATDVVLGNEPDSTKKLLESAGKDAERAIDKLTGND